MKRLATIRQHWSDLPHDLKALELTGRFSSTTLARARAYVSNGSIRDVEAKWQDAQCLEISAKVQGTRSRPYLTTLYSEFTKDGSLTEIFRDCSCPVGINCKHAAALLIHIQLKPPIQSDEHRGLPSFIETWLSEVQHADNQQESLTEKPSAKKQTKFLAYCLEPSLYDDNRLDFTLRPATQKANGNVAIDSAIARADPFKPAKYLTKEDTPVAVLFHQTLRLQNAWQTIKLTGESGGELLQLALSTGRLFIGKPSQNYRPSKDYRVLEKGDPFHTRPAWLHDEDGMLRPGLQGLATDLELLPTVPPFALDREAARLHPLTSSLSPAALSRWCTGPAVSAAHAEAISAHLLAQPNTSLPTPLQLETEHQEDVTPHARFPA